MASSLAPIRASFADEENETAQQQRPSVTWKLSPLSAHRAATQRSTSSGTYPASGFLWRPRLGSSPEINLGTQPHVVFLRPRTAPTLVLFSLMNSSEAAVTKYLPKSHLSRVIIRDNLNAQRLLEMEMKASEKTKKKMSHLHDHLKKKFMMDQLRKLGRWKREFMNIRQQLRAPVDPRSLHSNEKKWPP
ncbi:uncharacterized protein C5orf52 homolog [Pteronotus mesoamericanus]|uniref:uncharacterized protein C5orf52 homolog n=1 Tax=Pteronotus mesoamericanus TaxID=1884717 RepID=UPI0023EDA2DD|nr:uncharacterized protein C5orf52 homolog [Pteronotus parnellii mesoamericanus]